MLIVLHGHLQTAHVVMKTLDASIANDTNLHAAGRVRARIYYRQLVLNRLILIAPYRVYP
jgi:hypothetical protein